MPVGFRTLLTTTTDEDAPVVSDPLNFPLLGDTPMITVDTSPCRTGDLIVTAHMGTNVNIGWAWNGTGTPPAGLVSSGVISENLAHFGGWSQGNAFLWYVTNDSPDPLYGYSSSGPLDTHQAHVSVAAAAACYTQATTSGSHGGNNARFSPAGGPSPITTATPLTLPVDGALFTGQMLANDVTTFGTVNSPFTLRTSASGRFSATLNRYSQVQIGDLLDTGLGGTSFNATWTNTNAGVTNLDYFDADITKFVEEGIGVWIAQSQFAPVIQGLHLWQRI